MNYDQLKDMLMKKIDQELFVYKQNLIKNYSPDEIIQEAYKINFKEHICLEQVLLFIVVVQSINHV